MSTKTTIKRIALVAVSALGMGLMSVIPASAADVDDIATAQIAKSASVTDTSLVVLQTGSFGGVVRQSSVQIYTDKTYVLPADLSITITSSAGANNETYGIVFSPNLYTGTNSLAVRSGPAVSATTASFTDVLPVDLGAATGSYSTYTQDVNGDSTADDSALSLGTHYLYLNLDSTGTARAATSWVIKLVISNSTMTDVAPVVANSSTTLAGRVGQEVSIPVTSTNALLAAGSGVRPFMRFAASLTAQPAPGAGQSLVYPTLTAGSATINTTFTRFDKTQSVSVGSTLAISASSATRGTAANSTGPSSILYTTTTASGEEAAAVTSAQNVGTVKFTPVVSGTYTLVVWAESTDTGIPALSGSESFKTFTINVATGVSSVTLTPINSTAAMYEAATNGLNGSLIKVSLKDASGNAATLAPGESVTLTPNGSGDISQVNGSDVVSAEGVAYNLSSANFNSNGIAWVNMIDDTAEAVTLTASINGAASTSTTITYKDTVVVAAAPAAVATSGFGGTAPDYTVAIGANTFAWKATASTGSYVGFAITEGLVNGSTIGAITGYTTALSYDAVGAGDTTDTYASVSVAATTYATTEVAYEIATDATTVRSAASGTEGQISALTKAAGVLSVNPTAVNAVIGSTNTLTVTLKDVFGVAYPSQTVTASVTGKNPTTTSLTAVTDANGKASFSFTDANANTQVSDTVTFTSGSSVSATISYGTNAVDTLTATYTGSTDVVAGTTYTNIDEAYTGATGTYATMTVTAKNAAGATLAGVPVTFTVAGLTGAEVHTTYATVYTGTDGKATTRVSSYAAGKATITATAGAKTATGDVYFAQGDATAARTISAVATTGGVTATVKDRYGNPVAGAYVWATRSGSAYFGNGVSSTNGVTDVNGTVDFVVNGSGSVTLQLGSSSAASATYGQSYAAAGYDVDATNGTAVTAYVAGTSTTAQKGLGGSLAPAGVNKVTVDVTGNSTASDSIDAANEATDAANAATDAANAAAEAADAATAAAQDAQAAVAALATEVAAMISGIKAQIIRLTNLVVKIQKKVKA